MATFKKTEWHQVASEFTYDIPDEDLIEEFGSVERFYEVLSWQDRPFRQEGPDAYGDEPTDEETDALYEITCNYDYERDDDWWTDRKGGYEVTYDFELN
jgi:hypothetical protein